MADVNNTEQSSADPLTKKDPLIGTVLADKYEVQSLLGQGGMSVVYKARHRLMKNTVAVKMLLSERLHNRTNIARFQQEAQAASALSHPNVMTVHDLGVTPDGVPYLVMESIEGKGLSDIIKAEGQLEPQRCLDIMMQACDGLAAAHEKGIIHRDIKPSNIMISKASDGKELVKIVDFGIAKLLPTEGEEALRLTQTGESFGSPLYMSPEQCLAKPQDARSDIYSLGCMMYEALAGRPPLQGTSVLATMSMHLTDVPPGLADVIPDARLREQLEAILFKAMAKEPDHRYQSMRELLAALQRVRAGDQVGLWERLQSLIAIAKARQAPRKRKTAVEVAVLVAFITLLSLSGWSLHELFRTPPHQYIEMSWVRTLEPPPLRPANFEKMDRMAELMLNLIVGRQGQDSAALVDRLTTLGRFRMQYHNWTGAALCLQRAHDIATKSGLTSSVDFALNQIVLADCYYELEQYKDAWRLYQPAIDKLITIGEDLDRVVAIGRLGDILLRAGNLPHAEKYLKHAMHLSRGDRAEGRVIIKGTNPVSNQDFALTVSRLADVYRLEGKLGEAAQTYSEAIEIWKKLEGDGAKKDLAICLYYLGEVQRIQGHEQEAGSSYKEALDVAQSAFGPQDPHVANILYRYSDVLWHQNQWLQALDLKAKANAIRKTAK